jgi:poly(A) polymerase
MKTLKLPDNADALAARSICTHLHAAGHRAVLAGGCVRDLLLGHEPKDYDIASSARPQDILDLFPKAEAIGAAFGVILVTVPEGSYEVATFRKDGVYKDGRHPVDVRFTSIEEDAQRRDFTVNALFYDPENETVLDFVNGLSDLEKKIIRCVGKPDERFQEDHLRLLRAIRFSSQLDFSIDAETLASIGRNAHLISTVSPERIRSEMDRLLCHKRRGDGLEQLHRSGLMDVLFPELVAMVGCEQPAEFHPEGDVWIHTLLVMKQLRSPSFALALGTLLHDVGKPPTQTFEDRIRFNRHEKVGEEMAMNICGRLRCSNHDTERVTWLVSQHMRVAHIPEMRDSKRKRLLREEGFSDLLELFRADCLGSHGQLDLYGWILEYQEAAPEESIRPHLLVTGDHLIDWGYTPGPLFKEILTATEDAQLEGEIQNLEEATAWIQSRWPVDS